MSDTKQVLAWEGVSQVDSFDLFGKSVRQNPCGVMDGAPTEDTVGVVGALIVDVSTDSRKKDMWKCIAVTERRLEEGENGYDPAEPEKTKPVYKWNKVGSSSTEILTKEDFDALTDPDEDVDYIVNDNGVYLFYKWHEEDWRLIAGSVAEVVDILPDSGNTYTDYYMPNYEKDEDGHIVFEKDGNNQPIQKTDKEGNLVWEDEDETIPVYIPKIKSYFHYRWKEAEQTGIPARFVMIGVESYSTEQVDNLLKNIVDRINSDLGTKPEGGQDAFTSITQLIENQGSLSDQIGEIAGKAKNYKISYGEVPEGTIGILPPTGEYDNLLFLLTEIGDNAYKSEGYVEITGGGAVTSKGSVEIFCETGFSYGFMKGTESKEITVTVKAYQTDDKTQSETADTYEWRDGQGEIVLQGSFNNKYSLTFDLVKDLPLSSVDVTTKDKFTFIAYSAAGAQKEITFSITQHVVTAKLKNPENYSIFYNTEAESEVSTNLTYETYAEGVHRIIHTELNGAEIERQEVDDSGIGTQIIEGGTFSLERDAGAYVLSCYAEVPEYKDNTKKDKKLIFIKNNETKLLFGSIYDQSKNRGESITIEQYDKLDIPYYLYDENNSTPQVTLIVERLKDTATDFSGEVLETITQTVNVTSKENTWKYITEEFGKQRLYIQYIDTKNTTHTIEIYLDVEKKDLGFTPKKELLAFDFNPRLVEVGAKTWEDNLYSEFKDDWMLTPGYKPIKLIPSDNFDWVNGGFKKDKNGDYYFKVRAGTTATITYDNLFGTGAMSTTPFNSKTSPNSRKFSAAKEGMNFKLIFKTENVAVQDTVFLKCTEEREKDVKIQVGLEYINDAQTEWKILEDEKEQPTYLVSLEDLAGNGMADITIVESNKKISNVPYTYEEPDPTKEEVITRYIFEHDDISFIISFKKENKEALEKIYLEERRLSTQGLILSAREATLSHVYDGGTPLVLPYSEEEIIEFNLTIPPAKTTDGENYKNNIILTYEDGTPAMPQIYNPINSLAQKNKSDIIIGAPDCDICIYRMKAYQEGFTSREVLNEFILDATTPEELGTRHQRNNCINEDLDRLGDYYILPTKIATKTSDKEIQELTSKYPNLRFIFIETPHVTNGKKYKYPAGGGNEVDCRIECIYKNGRPEDNWYVPKAKHVGQGTTSNEYGQAARNINIHLNPDNTSNAINVKTIAGNYVQKPSITLTETSVPATVFNIKVNVASSENANNALLQNLYDQHLPYEPRSRAYYKLISDGQIIAKTTMEFVNCVVFIKETDMSSPYNVFNDEYYHFYSLGNLGDAKVTDETRTYGTTTYIENPEKPGEYIWKRELDRDEFVIEISDNNDPNSTFQTGFILTEENLQNFSGTEGEHFLGQSFYPITLEEFEDEDNSAGQALKTGWGKSFEFRYIYDEDETTLTTSAKDKWREFYRFVILSDKTDFESQLKNWFIEESALYYYLFTERFAMMDNRAKNTFWHWSKWYITKEEAKNNHNWQDGEGKTKNIFGETIYKTLDGYIVDDDAALENNGYRFDFWDYDNDSSIGINNSGKPTIPSAVEDIDKDYTKTPYYNGSGSVFFRRIRDYVDYQIVTIKGEKRLSTGFSKAQIIADQIPKSDTTVTTFDKWQNDFPEEFWRQDFETKYLRTLFEDGYDNRVLLTANTSYVNMYTGRKKYYRRNWETEHSPYFLSKYIRPSDDKMYFRHNTSLAGTHPDYDVYIPGLTIIPYAPLYASISIGNQNPDDPQSAPTRSKRLKKGETYQFDPVKNDGATDTMIVINHTDKLQSISGFAPYNIHSQFTINRSKKLSELILGEESEKIAAILYDKEGNKVLDHNFKIPTTNNIISNITVDSLPLLKKLNIENWSMIGNITLINNDQLIEFEAQKSGLTSVTFPQNYQLQNIELPKSLKTLSLSNQPLLTDQQNSQEKGFKIIPLSAGEYRFANLENITEKNTGLDELSILLENISKNTKLYENLKSVNLAEIDWDLTSTVIGELSGKALDTAVKAILEDFYIKKTREGEEISLSGHIHFNSIGTQLQKKYQDTWSEELTISATETIQDYTVRYVYIDKDEKEVSICDELIIKEKDPIPDIFIDKSSFDYAKDYLIKEKYANQEWSNWGKDGGNWGTYAPEGTIIDKTKIERLLPKDPSNRFTYYIGHPNARNSALVDVKSDGGEPDDDILYYESYRDYYEYLPYDGWKRKYGNGKIVEIDEEQCLALGTPGEPITMVVNTIPITNRFTVTWYLDEEDKTNQQSLHERTLVPYGTELVYDMPADKKLQITNPLGDHLVKTFKGWDTNTGCVTKDLAVCGLWDIGSLRDLDERKPLMVEMNPAEIYAIASNSNPAYEISLNDYEATNIILGQDFNFGEDTEEVLVGPKGTVFNTNWTAEDDPNNDCYKYYIVDTTDGTYEPENHVINLQNSFVFALDFKAMSDTGTFLKLSLKKNEDTIDFFQMYGSSGNSVIYYKLGDKSREQAAAVGYRERLIFLYDHLTRKVRIFISNDTAFTQYNIIESDVFSINDIIETIKDDGLIGDIVVSFSNSKDIQTYIYDCKIWKENLGVENCKKLANWPRELIQMRYSSNKYIKNSVSGTRYQYKENGESVDCHGYFICDGILSKTSPMNYLSAAVSDNRIVRTESNQNAGGWEATKLRTFLNGGEIAYIKTDTRGNVIDADYTENVPARVYNAFPENWRAIIKETCVPHCKESSGTRHESLDYIFLPSLFEYTYSSGTVSNGAVHRDGELLSWINETAGAPTNYRYFSGKTKNSYRPKSSINELTDYQQYPSTLDDVDITGKNIGDIIQLKHNYGANQWYPAAYMIGFNDYRMKSKKGLAGWWTRTYSSSGTNAANGSFATVRGLMHYGGEIITSTYGSTAPGIVPCFTI